MNTPRDGVRLRVYLGESDTHEGRAVYVSVVEEARRLNLAGATVLRGIMGYGAASRVHTARFLRLSEDLPVVVEIVDEADRIDSLLPFIDQVLGEGMVTLEPVRVHIYRAGRHVD